MLLSPSPITALLLGLVLLFIAIALTPVTSLTFLTGMIFVLSMDASFRKRVPLLLKMLLPFVLLMSMVALGRVMGGENILHTADEYLARFPFIVAVVTAATIFATCIKPWQALVIADACRLPRALTYVLVSLYPLSSHVQELGQRQLALLELKGVDLNSLVGRFLAYRRLVSPVFSSVLSQQVVHARSLSLRGFFFKAPVSNFPRFARSDATWGLSTLVILSLSYLSTI